MYGNVYSYAITGMEVGEVPTGLLEVGRIEVQEQLLEVKPSKVKGLPENMLL